MLGEGPYYQEKQGKWLGGFADISPLPSPVTSFLKFRITLHFLALRETHLQMEISLDR